LKQRAEEKVDQLEAAMQTAEINSQQLQQKWALAADSFSTTTVKSCLGIDKAVSIVGETETRVTPPLLNGPSRREMANQEHISRLQISEVRLWHNIAIT
jgi:hypothetical protein